MRRILARARPGAPISRSAALPHQPPHLLLPARFDDRSSCGYSDAFPRGSSADVQHSGESKMARFVLVHGAFAGAWIWGPLQERLNAAGHTTVAFDLPGLGNDRTPTSEVTLDSYAARLCEVLAASSERAIIVGNSMGGIVITQGAARCPERVAALVYVAAFLPKDGQSLLD